MFHNKKIKDLRTLSCQVFTGALLLKNNIEREKFIKKHNIDFENFKYVFGIIKDDPKKDKITSLKDKIAIGTCCYILTKMNIEYYIHYISYECDDDKNEIVV